MAGGDAEDDRSLGRLHRAQLRCPEATEIDDKAEVEIGWWISPSVWHQGYATEGALALRDETFERVGLDCIIGRHRPANVASGRIMERLGMTFERDAVGRYGEVVSDLRARSTSLAQP
jgi:RimJ/RimL family protein N-acetyltransferase